VPSLLVDTCVLIFLTMNEKQSGKAKRVLQSL
jgi:hypothetical protein